MNIEEFYNFCISFPGVAEDFPFDEQTLVFKVKGKIFALTDIDHFESVNLKCDPVKALEYRAVYEEIRPGYHMDKKHWNTVLIKGSLDDEFLKQLIKDSYDLVVLNLPKRIKAELEKAFNK